MLTDAWSPGRAAGKPEHVHLANQQLSKVSRSKLSCLLWCVSCLLSSSMTQFAFSLRRVYWYLLLRLLPTLCPLSLYSTSYMSVFTLKKKILSISFPSYTWIYPTHCHHVLKCHLVSPTQCATWNLKRKFSCHHFQNILLGYFWSYVIQVSRNLLKMPNEAINFFIDCSECGNKLEWVTQTFS